MINFLINKYKFNFKDMILYYKKIKYFLIYFLKDTIKLKIENKF